MEREKTINRENPVSYESEELIAKHERFYKMGEDIIRDESTGNVSGPYDQFLFAKDMREKGLDSFSIGKIDKIKELFENFNVNYIEEYNREIIPIRDARGFTLGKVVNFLCHNETI